MLKKPYFSIARASYFKGEFMKRFCIGAFVAFSLLLAASSAHAQRQGLYIPGLMGLNSAAPIPPGVYLQTYYMNYSFSGIKDQNGGTILGNLSGTLPMVAGGFSWVSPFRLLGANYGINLFLPAIGPNLDFNEFAIRGGEFGYSDTYFEPFSLRWAGSRYGIIFSYGIYFPTGAFTPGSPDNFGKGTWTHQLNAGATVFLDKERTWSITNWLHGEIHHQTRDTDLTIGSNLTWEWGIGKTFIQMIDFGAVGYGEWQLTNDTGSDAIFPNIHDRVYGVGAELGIAIPQIRSRIAMRGYGEFDARLRTQGHAIFLTFSSALWNNKPKEAAAP